MSCIHRPSTRAYVRAVLWRTSGSVMAPGPKVMVPIAIGTCSPYLNEVILQSNKEAPTIEDWSSQATSTSASAAADASSSSASSDAEASSSQLGVSAGKRKGELLDGLERSSVFAAAQIWLAKTEMGRDEEE